MSKEAEDLQRAAYDAHCRGQKALDEGDLIGAMVEDDDADLLALMAMLQRMRDRSQEG